jgi:hypothetical protein
MQNAKVACFHFEIRHCMYGSKVGREVRYVRSLCKRSEVHSTRYNTKQPFTALGGNSPVQLLLHDKCCVLIGF